MQINEINAYRFADNYQILSPIGDCVHHEHNEQEADAIAKYLTEYHGRKYTVKRNGHDEVRAAKAMGKKPLHMKTRDMMLKEVGVWA